MTDIMFELNMISHYFVIRLGGYDMGHLEQNKKNNEKIIRKLYHLNINDAEFVREYARQKGISESEVIQRALRRLEKDEAYDPFQELIGSVNVGGSQVYKHDEVIYDY